MVKIIVDSTFDTASAVKERLLVAPLTLHFGEEAYIDGVTINHKMFYEKLIESEVLPTTSQATPAVFEEAFAKVAAGDSAVVLTVSSKLSGTYQSAVIAAQDFENIYVVDSDSVTIGAGVLAELALRLADSGMEARKIVETLEAEKKKIQIIAMVDTLEYLKKGGRITPAAAALGTLLKLKPVLQIQGEKLDAFAKARTVKQAKNIMIEAVKNDFSKRFGDEAGRDMHLYIAYTKDRETALEFKTQVQEAFPQAEVDMVDPLSLSVACHIGPGALALACAKKLSKG